MVDCRKCKNIYKKSINEFTSIWACKLGILKEIREGRVEMPTECSSYEEVTEGKKYDTGKNRVGLMCEGFSRALWEVAKVSTFGANKYGANNWQLLENPKERYMDALCRHLFQHLQGEKIDDESGLLHLQHCAWNCLALLEFELKDKMEFGTEKGLQQACDMAKRFLYE